LEHIYHEATITQFNFTLKSGKFYLGPHISGTRFVVFTSCNASFLFRFGLL